MGQSVNLQGSDATSSSPGDEVPPGTTGSGEDVCPKCQGSGREDGHECSNCNGTGVITRAIGGG